MSKTITSEELIARYLHAIGRNLPRETRSDVTSELGSLLADSVEEKGADLGRALTLEETAGLLNDLGAPETVAARYAPKPHYLIGPGLYPIFMMVLKVILGVAAGLPILLMLISDLIGGRGPLEAAGIRGWATMLGMTYQIAFSGGAWAVISFAALERFGISAPLEEEHWNPLDLPPVDDRGEVSRVGVTVKIYAVIVFLLLFNLYPEWVGLYNLGPDEGLTVTSLSELGIQLPMLALNLWWLAALGLNLLLLRDGRWRPLSRWFEFGLGLFGAGILYSMVGLSVTGVLKEVFAGATPQTVVALIQRLSTWVLSAAFLITVAASVVRLYRLLRPEKPAQVRL
jgi:hypothetical protein